MQTYCIRQICKCVIYKWQVRMEVVKTEVGFVYFLQNRGNNWRGGNLKVEMAVGPYWCLIAESDTITLIETVWGNRLTQIGNQRGLNDCVILWASWKIQSVNPIKNNFPYNYVLSNSLFGVKIRTCFLNSISRQLNKEAIQLILYIFDIYSVTVFIFFNRTNWTQLKWNSTLPKSK